MHTIELCSAAVLQPFVKCLQRRGIDAGKYLEAQRIPPELVHKGDGKIFKMQAWQFFNAVEKQEGMGTFGFLEDDHYSVNDLGRIAAHLRQAVTLKDAIETFSYLVWSFAEGNVIWLEQGPQVSWLYCFAENQDRNVRAADHHTILILREVIRMAAGPVWQPDKIWFFTKPTEAVKKLQGLSAVKAEFLKDFAGIQFSSELLSVPITNSNPPNGQKAVRDSLMTPSPTSASQALTEVLTSFLAHNYLPTVNETLEILGSSRMTLHRVLAEEGTNYRKVVERVRFSKAKDLLENSSLSIKEIAFELCYKVPNNFSRAFNRMSGSAPKEYRAIFRCQ